jgi:uncharacterized protein
MKIWILFLSLSLSAIGQAQTSNALLWKISKKGSKKVSYIFGSMHTNDSLANTFSSEWWKAFERSKVFVGEVNATDMSGMLEGMAAVMMKDTSLNDLYTPEEYKEVSDFIDSRLDGFVAGFAKKMKPFFIMAMITEKPEEKGPYSEVMDIRLQKVAQEQKKKIVGLETMKEQTESVAIMDLKEQARLLLEFARNFDSPDYNLDKMLEIYYSQSLDELQNYAVKFEYPNELMTSLLDGRNKRFMERLAPLLKKGKVFCMVGALHLPGKNGILEMLKANGFVVEPVPFHFGT